MLPLIETRICWIITTSLGFLIVKDIIRWVGFFKWPSLPDTQIWIGFSYFIIFHLITVSLASLYRRLFTQLSLVFIYLNLLLFFYLLFLIKGLLFGNFPDQIWWLMIFSILIFLWGVLPKNKLEDPTFNNNLPLFGKIAIALWCLSSLCLWIPQNWDIHRVVFVDEGSFWFSAGEQMVKFGTTPAHAISYPGGGLHPFGIPFMASAPLTWSGWNNPWAIYCWPLVIIFSLGLWLLSQPLKKWALLFFVSSLLVVYSNESWPAQLMYQLVYGESICVVLLLVLISEMWRVIQKPNLSPISFLAISGATGLLALTKSPLDILVIPLELTFLFLVFRYQRSMLTRRLVISAIGCCFLPLVIWSIFTQHFHILSLSSSGSVADILSRIPHPNTSFLWLSLKSMWGLDQNMIYVSCLSLLILSFCAHPIRYLIIPFLLWILGWFFYYGYIFSYPTTQGDYLSGLRYLMPITLVLFWAAAIAYQETIDHFLKINILKARLLQCLAFIFMILMIFFGKIYLIT